MWFANLTYRFDSGYVPTVNHHSDIFSEQSDHILTSTRLTVVRIELNGNYSNSLFIVFICVLYCQDVRKKSKILNYQVYFQKQFLYMFFFSVVVENLV